MWSPVGPHVQWDLSNVVTCGTSCTVEPGDFTTPTLSAGAHSFVSVSLGTGVPNNTIVL